MDPEEVVEQLVDEVEEVEEYVESDDLDPQEEDEKLEFDFGGNKRQFSKTATVAEVAEDLESFTKGLWSDYTKRSQDLAAEKEILAANHATMQKLRSMNDETQNTYAEGLAVRSRIQQLQSIDLNALWQADPDSARQVSDELNRANLQFQQIVSKVSQLESTIAESEAQMLHQAAERGKQMVFKAIPDFEKNVSSLKEYAVSTGVSPKDADNWAINPVAAIAMYKAMKYDEMMAKTAKATAPKPPTATPIVPIKPSGSSTKVSRDLVRDAEKMSTDEWLKQRNAQIARKSKTG